MHRLSLVCALLTSALADAYVLKRDGSNEIIRWHQSRVEFLVDAELTQQLGEPQAFAAVQAAIDSYKAAVPSIAFSSHLASPNGIGYSIAAGGTAQNVITAPADWIFEEQAIAVTVVTSDTASHEILSADIAFNTKSHTFRALLLSGEPYDDIQNALTHELGHAMGLAHNPSDPKVVMYPSAALGETLKRFLAQDDRAGLAALYPPGASLGHDGPFGCSTTGAQPAGLLCLILLPALFFRKRGHSSLSQRTVRSRKPLRNPRKWHGRGWLLALLLTPALTRASDGERADAPAVDSAISLTGEVVGTRTRPPSAEARILITEVDVAVRSCLKGNCPAQIKVLVPGGRFGNIEQTIEDAPVPESGAMVGLTVAPGESLEEPTLKQARLYRLELARDLSAFERGVSTAGLSADLPRQGPPRPPGTQ